VPDSAASWQLEMTAPDQLHPARGGEGLGGLLALAHYKARGFEVFEVVKNGPA